MGGIYGRCVSSSQHCGLDYIYSEILRYGRRRQGDKSTIYEANRHAGSRGELHGGSCEVGEQPGTIDRRHEQPVGEDYRLLAGERKTALIANLSVKPSWNAVVMPPVLCGERIVLEMVGQARSQIFAPHARDSNYLSCSVAMDSATVYQCPSFLVYRRGNNGSTLDHLGNRQKAERMRREIR